MAGARPTQYTRDAVTQTTIERDAKDIILELDPGYSKRGLYKEHAYLHGWKIQTTAKGNVIKTCHYDETDEEYQQQVQICSWGSFCNYWKKNYSNMIVRKSSNDICATCYKYHMWQKGGGMFCHGIEGEEEKEEDDDSDYESNFDHEDNWDPEELVIDLEEDEESNDNKEEDDDGYTASERAYTNFTLEDDNNVEMVEEEEVHKEEKDERY